MIEGIITLFIHLSFRDRFEDLLDPVIYSKKKSVTLLIIMKSIEVKNNSYL